ncbi:MAG: cytochrome C [Xanthomonadales bacterium]|mgnify:CR=1 FL=1|nr:cytochrome C [Xanthomonadales bacterium]|tara:strand:+ start:52 stop:396 length:345 start_codon:yes stop_codon:yes gene_type:complete
MNRLAFSILVILTAIMATSSLAHAAGGDYRRGLEKSQVCQSCHGRTGNESLQPSYPRLAGQHEDYLVHALKSYRDGSRQNAVMAGFAGNLSDQDIADLAAWYSRQEGLQDLDVE